MNANSNLPDQPQSIRELQDILIAGFHEAMVDKDQVYNRETAELAIRCAAECTFKCLNAFDDAHIVEVVRIVAASAIATDPKTEGGAE